MSEDQQLVGERFAGRFMIEAALGSGGMSTVYLARHTVLRRRFAIKVLRSNLITDKEIAARFRREARAAGEIEHPNITSVFDFGHTEEGRPYLVMEYLEGVTLDQALERDGRFAPSRALNVLAQIAAGMSAAHTRQVIHRDLKPQNIVLTTHRTRGDFVKILDFGLAKILGLKGSRVLTGYGVTLGTPAYMSPELCRGTEIDQRSDIYSFGAVAFELFVGHAPFAAAGAPIMDQAYAHIKEAPPVPSEISDRDELAPEIDALILRCLEKEPEDRFPDAAALMREIQRLQYDLLGFDAPRTDEVPLSGRFVVPRTRTTHTEIPIQAQGSAEHTVSDWPVDMTDVESGGNILARSSRAVDELACAVRDRNLGTPEISRLLALKACAEDEVRAGEARTAAAERSLVEIEFAVREREAPLRRALAQLEHERDEQGRPEPGGASRRGQTQGEAALFEEAVVMVTKAMQDISRTTEDRTRALGEALEREHAGLEILNQAVTRWEDALVEQLRPLRADAIAIDPDLEALFILARVI